jgi:CBS domain-containing protein
MVYLYGVNGRASLPVEPVVAPLSPAQRIERSRSVDPAARGDDERTPLPSRQSALAAYAGGAAERERRLERVRHVGEVMTRPAVTLPLDAGLPELWQRLTRHGVRQLAVVDAAGVLVGLLRREDLLEPPWPERLGTGGAPADSRGWSAAQIRLAAAAAARDWEAQARRRASELLHSPVPAVEVDTELRRAAALMLEHSMSGLPVVDERGVVLGWIGRRELLLAIATDPPLDLWG